MNFKIKKKIYKYSGWLGEFAALQLNIAATVMLALF